jgi:hypothetical protein
MLPPETGGLASHRGARLTGYVDVARESLPQGPPGPGILTGFWTGERPSAPAFGMRSPPYAALQGIFLHLCKSSAH